MNIINLTTKPFQSIQAIKALTLDGSIIRSMRRLNFPIQSFLFARYADTNWESHLKTELLQEIPIFLVEGKQSNQNVLIPKKCAKKLPATCEVMIPNDEMPGNPVYDGIEIKDLLGVYIHKSGGNKFPYQQIFVWVDKVESCCPDVNFAQGLLQQVILHEYAHALMDITAYNTPINHNCSYGTSIGCRFFEEAFANAFSIYACSYILTPLQLGFIYGFVAGQADGYAFGNVIYNSRKVGAIKDWMTKQLIADNSELDNLQREIVRRGGEAIDYLCAQLRQGVDRFEYAYVDGMQNGSSTNDKLIKNISSPDIFAYKEVQNGSLSKIGFIYANGNIILKPTYDSVWSFDENNLIQVVNYDVYPYQYGLVNKQGQEQVPLKYEHITKNPNGTYTVRQNGGEFKIDKVGNVIGKTVEVVVKYDPAIEVTVLDVPEDIKQNRDALIEYAKEHEMDFDVQENVDFYTDDGALMWFWVKINGENIDVDEDEAIIDTDDWADYSKNSKNPEEKDVVYCLYVNRKVYATFEFELPDGTEFDVRRLKIYGVKDAKAYYYTGELDDGEIPCEQDDEPDKFVCAEVGDFDFQGDEYLDQLYINGEFINIY